MAIRTDFACRLVFLGLFVGMSMGCAHQLPSHPSQEDLTEPMVFGYIHVWQEEPSGRIFLPELASLEFSSRDGQRRYRVEIEAASSYFFLSLKPGHYQVNRVIIQEGEFRSSAEVPLTFEVPDRGVVYLGGWRIQVDPPNYTRELEVTIVSESVEAIAEMMVRYPSLSSHVVLSSLAKPPLLRARLFEVTPYPRFRYFNRHNST